MFFLGVGTAVPQNRYTQTECWQAIAASAQFTRLTPRSRAILKKVLNGDNGIHTRHLALAPLTEVFEISPDVLQARFALHAPALAESAARAALCDAGVEAVDIDAVIISTCTGYLCPGLTSYVSERLGLPPNIFALDLVGQGCGAAMPNLRAAESLLLAGRAQRVLSICVEVCSAAFYLDDDPGVLISACLFGDGAGAAVVGRDPVPGRRQVRWVNADSLLRPEQRELLRFRHEQGMLKNVLSPAVPEIAGRSCAGLLTDMLEKSITPREDITGWILHTGGRDVLQSLMAHLNISPQDIRHSASVLAEFGNLSSPTVYFVLQRALRDSVPDGRWWMSSFGAGFSCHGALLEVRA